MRCHRSAPPSNPDSSARAVVGCRPLLPPGIPASVGGCGAAGPGACVDVGRSTRRRWVSARRRGPPCRPSLRSEILVRHAGVSTACRSKIHNGWPVHSGFAVTLVDLLPTLPDAGRAPPSNKRWPLLSAWGHPDRAADRRERIRRGSARQDGAGSAGNRGMTLTASISRPSFFWLGSVWGTTVAPARHPGVRGWLRCSRLGSAA